jgi:hypothetical protein
MLPETMVFGLAMLLTGGLLFLLMYFVSILFPFLLCTNIDLFGSILGDNSIRLGM